ncbi:ankyrin repeat domain-containing protein 49-like [Haliotis rufescens]|uniref:ankyrin repeat domain-containing protein 49-like n=1 Tax=Haliotis rufescens TaxID=6454 RepID=UPI00201F901E|nr:ankyrin repeat domain-containing protein 49-like [Haliotis rufescens]
MDDNEEPVNDTHLDSNNSPPTSSTYQATDQSPPQQKASSDPTKMEALNPGVTPESELRATSREEETRKSRIPLEPGTRATPTPASRDPQADRDLRDASTWGNVAAVKRILAAGRADVNSKDLNGWTPVLLAARKGHREVVELLVRKGADVSVLTFNDDNILHLACMGSDVETVKYVLSLNVVDINARTKGGRTAVSWARYFSHRRVENLLLSLGAQ